MSLLLKPFEIALNAAIRQDPETHAKLAAFDSRSLLVHISDMHQSVHIRITEQQLQLTAQHDDNADLSITGSALALLKLGEHPDNLFSAEIKIHGDVQFAKQLQDILEAFDFDWEQQIARVTGDVIAQPLSHGLKQGFSWLKNSAQSLQLSTAEYLKEEAKLLPDRIQIEDYMNAVDTLTADTDRLEARIKRLIKND